MNDPDSGSELVSSLRLLTSPALDIMTSKLVVCNVGSTHRHTWRSTVSIWIRVRHSSSGRRGCRGVGRLRGMVVRPRCAVLHWTGHRNALRPPIPVPTPAEGAPPLAQAEAVFPAPPLLWCKLCQSDTGSEAGTPGTQPRGLMSHGPGISEVGDWSGVICKGHVQ